MRLLGVVLLSMVLATAAFAGIHSNRSGVLATCSSGCVVDGATTNWLLANPGPVVFIGTGTGTVVFTLEQSADDGATWVVVPASTCSASGTTCRLQVPVAVGLYRFTHTCSVCTYTMYYHQGPGSMW